MRIGTLVACLLGLVAGCNDDTGTGGGGASGGGGACPDKCPTTGGGGAGAGGEGGAEPYLPTLDDVQYHSVSPLPLGAWIVFNDESTAPNTVNVMTPEGETEITVFEAFRVLDFGVSNDANRIAFSAGDPEQEAHYGVTVA